MHIPLPEQCDWVAQKMESERSQLDPRFILKRILAAESFEKFIHTRYVGSKRFSLEGLAVLIPLLDGILDQAAANGFETAMISMSHRGRLNVMHHIAGISADKIFADFEDVDPRSALGGDDVKYHKGATGLYTTANGHKISIDVSANPSHLEAINPVLMGRVRARQERLGDSENKKILGIMLHGDAAFAGQGIAAETLNYVDLPGFRIGGVVHVVVNNLIGFTATPKALHSTRYATDIARRLNIPIFHVNGETPKEVLQVAKIATDYKTEFQNDVVIDLMGYRRYGHSEIDDPTLTSPVLYRSIKDRPLLWESFAEDIGIAEEDIAQLQESSLAMLEDGLEKGRSMTVKPQLVDAPNYWDQFAGGVHEESLEIETKVSAAKLEEIGTKLSVIPESFKLHPKLKKIFKQRQEMAMGERKIDWGMAEALAFGTLLEQGVPVRITGQDSRRGTFSHRQSVLYDYENGEEYIPLMQLTEQQARFDVYDSMLSEAAAVGFEYGFTRDYPEALVCWEAQFGDFVNGAQIIIDQFISAGEDKWNLLSGLVMLLPHGFEGQGPEHSHARLERFLQLCAEDNMQVCHPSTSGQYFHLLRRQVLRKWRKPLIVMTPKGMLRAQVASSDRSYLESSSFQNVIPETEVMENVDRLLVCSGKVVHELRAARKKRGDTATAIVSVEQLYPLPEKELKAAIRQFSSLNAIVWVQEEPSNMAAWRYMQPALRRLSKGVKVLKVSRSASASPATGSPKAHALEQEALINLAFTRYSEVSFS
ncbi:UNVERIFIED_CONTAM: hypothetical protein GTU68_020740 [Idotea baltica]|nr:hypothetical protein [Idotea baltica]